MTCTRCQGCMTKDHFLRSWRALKVCGWQVGAASTAETSLTP